MKYNFTYDSMGRKVGVAVGSQMLSTSEYQDNTALKHYGTLTRMRYGNGFYVRNEYDDFNRVEKVYCGKQTNGVDADTLRYEYAYNAKGQVAHVVNHALDQVTESEYDLADRPCRIKTHEADGTHIYTGEVAYDETRGNLSEFREVVGSERTEYTTTFGYDEEDRPTTLTYTGYGSSTNTYDKLGRVTNATVTVGSKSYPTTFTFVAGGQGTGSTTGLVESITQTGGNCSYEYDDNGNILTATVAGKTAKYTYDALGQLTRVDDQSDTTSGTSGTTWVYEYDCGGNITAKKRYAYTTGTLGEVKQTISYSYDTVWKDKLTSYNGASISYDDIGNPTSDGTWTYTWENGRQLAGMSKSGTTVSFKYNASGLRTRKIVNGVMTKYTLHGKNVVHMTKGSDNLHFFYDAQNRPAVVVYNGTAYAYAKNLQGDIIAILNSAGTTVVSYTYDAWGKPISTTGTMKDTLGKLNPFRYRGYVFDEESELYYLRSRYYQTDWCRLINADKALGSGKLLSYNLYAYCRNKPVSRSDESGNTDMPAAIIMERPRDARHGTHDSTDLLPVEWFLDYLQQMVDEKWMYPDIDRNTGKRQYMDYRCVDCVGVYRYCMQYHFTPEAYDEIVGGTMVESIFKYSIEGELLQIRSRGQAINYDLLVPGMAVFIANKSENYYKHIAYYIGYTEEYGPHTIIESNVDENGQITAVHYATLTPEAGYVWAGYLKGIDYQGQ